ncbi:MAG: transposase [Limnochordaceae bacterium]|nr:transposase [Limnochordaceae bacterium]MBE3584302.1 transposase [Limnochordaceae bacterium]
MARSSMARFTRKAKIQIRAASKIPVSSAGGGIVLWKALDRLGLGQILADLGMMSRGWALAKIVFDLVLQAWLQADSVTELADKVNADALLTTLGAPADRTTLTRILNRRRYRWQELFRRLAYATWKALRLPPSAPVTLVIDDTAIEKSGVKMEGSSWVYDSSQNRKVWGYTVVTAALVAGGHRIPVDFVILRPRENKYAVAQEIIQRVRDAGIRIDALLFDGWYGHSTAFLNQQGSTFWVTRLHSDRRVEVEGRSVSVEDLFGETRRQPKALRHHPRDPQVTYRTYRAHLPGYGDITVVVVHDEKDKETPYRALAANDPRMHGRAVIDWYHQRWHIETIHREAKSQLGLHSFHVRSLRSIHGHIACTLVAVLVAEMIRWLGKGLGELKEAGVEEIRRRVLGILGHLRFRGRKQEFIVNKDQERLLEALTQGLEGIP